MGAQTRWRVRWSLVLLLGLSALVSGCAPARSNPTAPPAALVASRPWDGIRVLEAFPPASAVVISGSILGTDDMGKTWTDLTPPEARLGFAGADFVTRQLGVVAVIGSMPGTASLLVTSDGGTTWSVSEDLATGDVASVSAAELPNGDLQVLVRNATGVNFNVGLIGVTSDGGLNWSLDPVPFAGDLYGSDSGGQLIVGGPIRDRLVWSRDGMTWANVELTPELEGAAFGIPRASGDRWLVPASFASQEGPSPQLSRVGLVTVRSGQAELNEASLTPGPAVLAIGVPAAAAVGPSGQLLLVSERGLFDSRVGSEVRIEGPFEPPQTILFTDDSTGWSLAFIGGCDDTKTHCVNGYRLAATIDGGHHWVEVKPPDEVR